MAPAQHRPTGQKLSPASISTSLPYRLKTTITASDSSVHVGVFDDEVEYTHHDLNNNYDASRHVFINGIRQNPAPVGNAEYHGTAVAGVIAAENDGVGTVGVAFGTSITGVEILGLTSDAAIVQSMAQQHNFDVVNHSWGFVVPFADSQLSPNAAWSSFFASFPDAVQNRPGRPRDRHRPLRRQ